MIFPGPSHSTARYVVRNSSYYEIEPYLDSPASKISDAPSPCSWLQSPRHRSATDAPSSSGALLGIVVIGLDLDLDRDFALESRLLDRRRHEEELLAELLDHRTVI